MKQGPWTDVYALAAVVLLRDHRQDAAGLGRPADGRPLRAAGAARRPAATAPRFLRAIDRALVVMPGGAHASRSPTCARDLGMGRSIRQVELRQRARSRGPGRRWAGGRRPAAPRLARAVPVSWPASALVVVLVVAGGSLVRVRRQAGCRAGGFQRPRLPAATAPALTVAPTAAATSSRAAGGGDRQPARALGLGASRLRCRAVRPGPRIRARRRRRSRPTSRSRPRPTSRSCASTRTT